MEKKKYLSYSLWGDQPVYITGMIRNLEQAKVIYPDWQPIIYHDKNMDKRWLMQFREGGAITQPAANSVYGMFWRFYAADLPDCAYAIFRDSDSRLSLREKAAVDEWLKENKDLHIMRDHPYHMDAVDNQQHYILGGMWGIKGNIVNLSTMIHSYASGKDLQYGADQIFLNVIYQQFGHSAIIHDDFFDGRPFPLKREGYRFVGERFDEYDQPMGNDWMAIKDHYQSKRLFHKLSGYLKRFVHRILGNDQS